MVTEMTEKKALALAILALDEVAKRHGNEGAVSEWYVARRTIRAMLDKCEIQTGLPAAEASRSDPSQT